MMDQLIGLAENLRIGLQAQLRTIFQVGEVQGAILEVDRY